MTIKVGGKDLTLKKVNDGIIISGLSNPVNDSDAVNKKYLDTQVKDLKDNLGNIKLKYKANSSNTKEVDLSTGLNFVKDDNSNIDVEVKENGEIKHKLANNLTQIDSIKSGKDASGSKISFTSTNNGNNAVKDKIEFIIGNTNGGKATTFNFSEKGLDLGSKQIINVASGIGTTPSTNIADATSNVDKVLTGNNIDDIKNNVANVQDLSDVAKAIINKGFTLKGTKLKKQDDGSQKEEQESLKLGGTISIESSTSNNGKSKSPDQTEQVKKENDIEISVTKEKIQIM